MNFEFALKPDTLLNNGKYRIERFIAAGGFGCTYEAVHVELNKRVAIKECFIQDFCNRDESTSKVIIGKTQSERVNKLMDKFTAEAQRVSNIEHQNIVEVTDIFEDNNTRYFVMKYIKGESLSEMLRRTGKLKEDVALRYIRQVADALKYIHSSKICHLDIKPGNIMVDENGKVVLIDFGVSKQYDDNKLNTSTVAGQSPGFAPPEQMNSRKLPRFSPASDIYSLGATFYKLLSGITPPIPGDISSGLDKITPLPQTISANVRNAIEKAMQQNYENRPQTIDEFLNILNTPTKNEIRNNETELTSKPKKASKKRGCRIFLSILFGLIACCSLIFSADNPVFLIYFVAAFVLFLIVLPKKKRNKSKNQKNNLHTSINDDIDSDAYLFDENTDEEVKKRSKKRGCRKFLSIVFFILCLIWGVVSIEGKPMPLLLFFVCLILFIITLPKKKKIDRM